MAITTIAPKSSTIANAVRKILIDTGTLFPSIEMIAKENAMSVAIGIPQPFSYLEPWLKK